MALTARGSRDTDGALTLDAFALDTRALQVAGRANLNSDAWPTLLDIEGTLADPDGTTVRLPSDTRIARASIAIDFDADQSDALVARINAAGVEQTDATVDEMALRFDGTLSGAVGAIGALSGRVNVDASGVDLSDPALSRAVGSALSGGFDIAYADDAPLVLTDLSLASAAWALSGQAQVNGFDKGFETQFDTALVTQDLSAFAGLAGLELSGAGDLSLSGTAALGGFFDVEVRGQTRELALGVAQADTLLAGQTDLVLAARRDTTGTFVDRLILENPALELTASADLRTGGSVARFNAALADIGQLTEAVEGPLTVDGTATQSGEVWDIAAGLTGPLGSTATGTARVAPDGTEVALEAVVGDLSPIVPQIDGGVQLTATAEQVDGAWQFGSTIDGPAETRAEVTGAFDGTDLTARYDVAVPTISAFAPGVPGAATLNGDVAQTADGWAFDAQVTGPYDSAGTVSGTYTASLDTDFNLRLPNVAAVAPGVNGPLALDGTLSQTADGWEVITDVAGPYSSSGRVSASLRDGVLGAGYALTLPNVAALVPGLAGSMTVNGTAQQEGADYDIIARVAGPSGTTATTTGRVQADGTLNLNARGQAQLGLANAFIAPRTIIGTADFDLSVNGPPALSSVSGEISTRGAQVATPSLPVSISDLSGTANLSDGQAVLDFTGAIAEGGSVGISGPITLSGNFPAQLDVSLNAVTLRDPRLYNTTVDGQVDLRGPLTGGAAISGQINLGETDVRVPSSGISTFGSVPNITHIGATRPVMRTRERAGLVQTDDQSTTGSAYPLDVLINAPNRIFVRGRGIDAEMGGQLRLSGTTADMISTGQFDLIRGRIDILTKRFELSEGRVSLQGRFEPYLRLVAETPTSTGSARLVVDGPADDPEVTFESTPAAPQDQVLAQIFFGRDITQLSAFQALQLASAVATIAGQGGEGIVSRLRGSFALDDLDVTSDDEGNTAVRAGKYISDNVYTDVTVGGPDGPEVSLNIDLTPNVTARGTVAADANTGIGIFIERDY
ncbi:translocation/assembly module TamB domain-containing protein [uncultured Tateyamaria sp.]|uniref:translocation/assembly module TamB domain-containing protein n=1 Tax=uncultured Tateyamaria sp. TaxID=455651 RepID=UPI0026150FBC|nr:translocation/assembly module TamB domain-containing protein [uncultured Tateyamaria sp.]